MPMTEIRPPLERPRVTVTRHLMPAVEARMRELFDVVLNEADVPMTREQLAAAMQDCDVLVPTVTDRIDAVLTRPRSLVRSADFTGPDRRRRRDGDAPAMRRESDRQS